MKTATSTVLIDQSMVCEAARLIERAPVGDEYLDYLGQFERHRDIGPHYRMHIKWWPPTYSERLFHLVTLLDAVALYESFLVGKLRAHTFSPSISRPLRYE